LLLGLRRAATATRRVVAARVDVVAPVVTVLDLRLDDLDIGRRRLLFEDRDGDHADVARLALLAGVRVVDRREAERRDIGERGAETLDARLAERGHDVPALAEVATFAIDHVETVDRDNRFDAIAGRVGDANRVATTVVALHVVAALERVGRRGLTGLG